ncbi:MAG: SDR family NAD(P)-dependent oxidoreductase, partial [Sphingomonas sp.]
MPTILITGCSSGYGRHIAQHFLDRGWTVIATMRTPRTDVFSPSDRLRILPLDVTKSDSIHAAFEAAGPIDALVNNAGIGVVGAFEATPMEHIRKVFETNTFGTMAMTQAAIPGMRERGSGVIVNVT